MKERRVEISWDRESPLYNRCSLWDICYLKLSFFSIFFFVVLSNLNSLKHFEKTFLCYLNERDVNVEEKFKKNQKNSFRIVSVRGKFFRVIFHLKLFFISNIPVEVRDNERWLLKNYFLSNLKQVISSKKTVRFWTTCFSFILFLDSYTAL